ncbi:MAG TPA: hypothetical protein EYP78_01750 [Candidatus Omnitrophica bacterium]|nr:hypothetical protein [Candidatus Omnitrophota bacterium]
MSDSVHLVEPSIETASYLRELLRRNSLLNREKENHESRFYVTDDPDNFSQLARLFLGQKLKEPVLVHLEGEEQ